MRGMILMHARALIIPRMHACCPGQAWWPASGQVETKGLRVESPLLQRASGKVETEGLWVENPLQRASGQVETEGLWVENPLNPLQRHASVENHDGGKAEAKRRRRSWGSGV